MKSFRRLSLGYFVALAALVLAGTAQAETIHNKGIIPPSAAAPSFRITKAKAGVTLKSDNRSAPTRK